MFANQNEINRLLTDIYLAFLSIVNLLTSEVRVMAQYLKDAWQPFIAAGEIALFEQRFDDAVLNFQMALLDAEYGEKSDQRIVTTLDLLSETYQQLNRLEEAEAVSLRSLRIKQDSGAFSKFDILRGMFKLSKLYFYQSKLGAAAYTTNRLLELSEQTLGSSHPLVAMVARQLADLYNELGSSREAEQFYHRASAVQPNQFDNRSVLPVMAQVCA
jgi:tetratricopeptide (TPR) repeat protein